MFHDYSQKYKKIGANISMFIATLATWRLEAHFVNLWEIKKKINLLFTLASN
jgi:hypothetical protein